jgi:hypothetical protein
MRGYNYQKPDLLFSIHFIQMFFEIHTPGGAIGGGCKNFTITR